MTDRSTFTLVTILPSENGKATVLLSEPFPVPVGNMRFRRKLRENGPQWEALSDSELMQRLVRALMISTVDNITLISEDQPDRLALFATDRVSIYWADRRNIGFSEMAAALKASLVEHRVADHVQTFDEIIPQPATWMPSHSRISPGQLVTFDPWALRQRQQLADLVMMSDPGRLALGQVDHGRSAWVAGIRRLFQAVRYRILIMEGRLVLERVDPGTWAEDGFPYVVVSPGNEMGALIARLAADPELLAQVLALAGIESKEE